MNWYVEVLKKYAVFSGRARRAEYWMFCMINLLIVAFVFVMSIAADTPEVIAVAVIYLLAVIVPGIAVGVRRLHDTDRSGWWLLINFVPYVGEVVFLVFTVLDGTPGENRYGPDPKAETGEQDAVFDMDEPQV